MHNRLTPTKRKKNLILETFIETKCTSQQCYYYYFPVIKTELGSINIKVWFEVLSLRIRKETVSILICSKKI